MSMMTNDLYYHGGEEGKNPWRNTVFDRTGRSHLEQLLPYGNRWSPKNKKKGARQANAILQFMPKSEIGIRMQIQAADNPTLDKLKNWEKKLRIDSEGFAAIGNRYREQQKNQEAIRCYQKSLKIRSTLGVARDLAALLHDAGEYEDSEMVLIKFIGSSNDAMEIQFAQRDMAKWLGSRGLWREAKPYAEAAAETWSTFGLADAARVNEYLARWNESEKWIKAETESYPSHSGYNWYAWCRRNGRGDLETAKKHAHRYLSVLPSNPSRRDWVTRGAFYLMEGDIEKARDAYRKALDFYPSISCTCMLAYLSRKLDDENTRETIIDELVDSITKKESPGLIELYGLELMKMLRAKKIDDQLLERLEQKILALEPLDACLVSYLIGQELLGRNQPKQAEPFLRRCYRCRRQELTYYTLAGYQLSKQFGTSRPDDDEMGPDDFWPPQPAEPARKDETVKDKQ